MRETFKVQLQKTGESDFYAASVTIAEEVPFMPVSVINALRREILEKLMAERLKNYPHEIQKPLQYSNFPLKEVDYRANIHNQTAKEFYENCGAKVHEMSIESSGGCSGRCLMQTKHCLKYAFNMCKSPDKLFLIDEKGKKYRLDFDCKKCEMRVAEVNKGIVNKSISSLR